jgi:hypothetical protein
MQINLWVVIVGAVLSMVIGFIWYGPLFGRIWMKIEGANPNDVEDRKKMQKGAGPLYAIQFLLSLVQVYIITLINTGLPLSASIHSAILLWFGFSLPLVAGNAMWNNKPRKVKWTQFLIQAGYQLILFIAFGILIAVW